jgi:hypothetical protein
MGTTPNTVSEKSAAIRGKIIEAEVKVSVDPGRPLPLACALYAVEAEGGVWLCAYYGSNRSVFDYLPQKGAELDEMKLGIAFHVKEFVPGGSFQPTSWDEFKKSRMMTYDAHAAG